MTKDEIMYKFLGGATTASVPADPRPELPVDER